MQELEVPVSLQFSVITVNTAVPCHHLQPINIFPFVCEMKLDKHIDKRGRVFTQQSISFFHHYSLFLVEKKPQN